LLQRMSLHLAADVGLAHKFRRNGRRMAQYGISWRVDMDLVVSSTFALDATHDVEWYVTDS